MFGRTFKLIENFGDATMTTIYFRSTKKEFNEVLKRIKEHTCRYEVIGKSAIIAWY